MVFCFPPVVIKAEVETDNQLLIIKNHGVPASLVVNGKMYKWHKNLFLSVRSLTNNVQCSRLSLLGESRSHEALSFQTAEEGHLESVHCYFNPGLSLFPRNKYM